MGLTEAAPVSRGARDDIATIGTVGAAHFSSHFLQLAMAPLLPLISDEFGVGFTELGWVVASFYATSGAGQVLAGILVDRVGAHRLLIGGLYLQAVAIFLMAFVPGWLFLFPLAIAAGLGNTVYHPADLSILSHRVSGRLLGRAFASHSITGSIGFTAGPVLVGLVGAAFGWRLGLAFGGVVGLAIATLVTFNRRWLIIAERETAAEGPVERAAPIPFLDILRMPVVVLGFGFFFLTSLASSGVQQFAISAFNEGYGVTLALATLALAFYQGGMIAGNVVGGIYADRTRNHQLTAMVGVAVAAVFSFGAAWSALPFPVTIVCLVLAGAAFGVVLPSRDVLIREVAPAGGLGKVFGAVYSGLDVGALIGPLIFGMLLDRHLAEMVFVAIGVGFLASVATLVGLRPAVVRR